MQQLHPDDVIWRNARLATMDPDHSAPYGLTEHCALVVRGQTILAVILKQKSLTGTLTALI
jgi:imidazolonepropionase